MKVTKYIVVSYGGHETMVVFEDLFNHSEFARSLGREVVSAGFLSVSDSPKLDVHVYGESVSLGVKSREDKDKRLAQRLFEIDRE